MVYCISPFSPPSALAVKFCVLKRLSTACFNEVDDSDYKNETTTFDLSSFNKKVT